MNTQLCLLGTCMYSGEKLQFKISHHYQNNEIPLFLEDSCKKGFLAIPNDDGKGKYIQFEQETFPLNIDPKFRQLYEYTPE